MCQPGWNLDGEGDEGLVKGVDGCILAAAKNSIRFRSMVQGHACGESVLHIIPLLKSNVCATHLLPRKRVPSCTFLLLSSRSEEVDNEFLCLAVATNVSLHGCISLKLPSWSSLIVLACTDPATHTWLVTSRLPTSFVHLHAENNAA